MELHTQEDRSTRSVEAARHWVDFYDEPIRFEENVLAQMRQLREGGRPEIQAAVDESNIQPLQGLIADFRGRLDFWHARLAELAG